MSRSTGSPRRNSLSTAGLIVAVVALVGILPRVVVGWLGVDNPWAAFFYQYGLGGLVFGVGLWVIRHSGACNFQRPRDRYWFGVLVFGYVWYAAIHATLIVLATHVPFRGPGGG